MFAFVIFLVVGAVSWIVANRARRAFDQVDQQRTGALVTQYQTEFDRRGQEVSRDVDRLARSERMQRIASEAAHGGDTAQFLSEAAALAQEYRFDFLDVVSADGTIISSAEWPAHFGYKLPVPEPGASGRATLHSLEVP